MFRLGWVRKGEAEWNGAAAPRLHGRSLPLGCSLWGFGLSSALRLSFEECIPEQNGGCVLLGDSQRRGVKRWMGLLKAWFAFNREWESGACSAS